MPTNTLIDTSDDLGDTIATYLFDIELADSLLTSAGMTLAGCLTAVAAVALFAGDETISLMTTVVLAAAALIAAWGVLVASSRLRRKDDRFVVRRLGLTHHHGATVTHTKWTDIASVEHSGTPSGSQLTRWNGNDYRCQINLRNGSTNVFDNYVVSATSLGHEIEQHSRGYPRRP